MLREPRLAWDTHHDAEAHGSAARFPIGPRNVQFENVRARLKIFQRLLELKVKRTIGTELPRLDRMALLEHCPLA